MAAKALGSLLAITLTVYAAIQLCYWPFVGNRRMRRAQEVALAAMDSGSRVRASRLARDNAAVVDECLRHTPSLVNFYMIGALNRRVLGQFDEAIKLYETALQWDRRPEIYLQLGLTHLQMDNREEAKKALQRAVNFSPHMLQEIPDEVMVRQLARS